MNLDIKKGSYSLLSDPDEKTNIISQFGFFANNFSVDMKVYDGKLEASVDLKSFEFSFIKNIKDENEKPFAVVKSTAEKGTSFLNVKFLSLKEKSKTTTTIDVYIQHIDVIFLNQIIKDLINFFKVQNYDSEAAAGLVSGANMVDYKGAGKATEAITGGSNDIAINVNLLSPRIMVPMTKYLADLKEETNLFVFYLGDLEFMHNIRSGPMKSLGAVFNIKLNHVKLEYWEDFKKAMKHLLIEETDSLDEEDGRDKMTDLITHFIILDFVALVKYVGSGDGKSKNVNVLLENFDLRINPYTFHQLLNIRKLIDFSNDLKQSPESLRIRRQKIDSEAILSITTPAIKKLEDKYEMRYVVVTKSTLFIFEDQDKDEPECEFLLNGYAFFVVEDMKTKGYILKLWKDKVIVSIAFRNFSDVKFWLNKIIEVVPGVKTKNIKEREKEELPYIINVDLIVKTVEVWLYNEVFERSLVTCLRYVEIKLSQESKILKAKIALESLLVENFEKSFSSRGLKLLTWIGSSQNPTKGERRALRIKDKEKNENNTYNTSHTMNFSSEASDIPKGAKTQANAVAPSMRSSILDESLNLRGQGSKNLQKNADNNNLNFKKGGDGKRPEVLANNAQNADKVGKSPNDVADKVDKNIENWSKKGQIRDGNIKEREEDRDERGDFRNFDDYIERKNEAEMDGLRRIDEGFILYLEKTDKVIDVDMHVVNITMFWDTDYIQSLQKKISDFIKIDYSSEDATKQQDEIKRLKELEIKKRRKKPDPDTEDELKIRANVRVDRVCFVARTKNQNLSDVIMIDFKVVFTQFVKRKLVNIYMKRLALRDLTGYPFTKSPDRLKSYRHQSKNLMASFIETSKITNVENLDNNGVLVVVEIIEDKYIGEDRLANKTEVILNNGEVNFFLQPVLRFVDFVLVQLLGYLTPDDSKQVALAELLRRATELKRMNLNIFLKNTRVNLIPNFYVDKCLILEVPMVLIINEQYKDPSRNPTGQNEVPIYSENMSIEVKTPYLRGLRKDFDAFNIKDITVSIDRLLFSGNIDRLLGVKRGRFYFNYSL